MQDRQPKREPLSPEQRDDYERDLISFSDRELDMLGDIRGLDVLYAGGAALLWIEGLSQRIGEEGSLTAIEADAELVRRTMESLREADLAAPVDLVVGSVFDMPLPVGAFDLVYSAGLFHELDVGERTAGDALAALVRVARSGARISTGDWVDMGDEPPPTDLEWERMDAEAEFEMRGVRRYGIQTPERLVGLHEEHLRGVRWRVAPPHPLRHLDEIMLSEPDELAEYASFSSDAKRRLTAWRKALKERIRREGYGRSPTLCVEGNPPG